MFEGVENMKSYFKATKLAGNKGKIFLLSVFLLFILISFSRLKAYSEVQNKQNEKSTIGSTVDGNISSKEAEEHVSPYASQSVIYTNNKISIWVNQFLLIKGGDASGELVEGPSAIKTSVILHYSLKNKVEKINLTALALKYNLYGGVERISTSPGGKYIAVEFGSLEQNDSLLINTTNNTAKMLWFNQRDNNSMVSIAWKENNEEVFAFMPSVGKSGDLETYNLKDNSIKRIGTIQAKTQIDTSCIIKWTTQGFEIIDMAKDKIYKLK
jgi:hypothetical protein